MKRNHFCGSLSATKCIAWFAIVLVRHQWLVKFCTCQVCFCYMIHQLVGVIMYHNGFVLVLAKLAISMRNASFGRRFVPEVGKKEKAAASTAAVYLSGPSDVIDGIRKCRQNRSDDNELAKCFKTYIKNRHSVNITSGSVVLSINGNLKFSNYECK